MHGEQECSSLVHVLLLVHFLQHQQFFTGDSAETQVSGISLKISHQLLSLFWREADPIALGIFQIIGMQSWIASRFVLRLLVASHAFS